MAALGSNRRYECVRGGILIPLGRYSVPVLPLLAIMAAFGVDTLLSRRYCSILRRKRQCEVAVRERDLAFIKSELMISFKNSKMPTRFARLSRGMAVVILCWRPRPERRAQNAPDVVSSDSVPRRQLLWEALVSGKT